MAVTKGETKMDENQNGTQGQVVEGGESVKAKTSFRYRDENGKMVTKEVAIEKRWAHKEDGTPTKIYLHRLEVREAIKNGLPIPIRPKKRYEAGSESHNGIASPFALSRRSGYGVIWQVLAEKVGEVVPTSYLTAEVNRRLQENAPEWYSEHYSEENPYNVEANAYVMTRAPYNRKIEAMQQRVIFENNGFKLMVNVTEPRVLRKRGRKPGSKNKPKVQETVVADTTKPVEIQEGVAVTENATEVAV